MRARQLNDSTNHSSAMPIWRLRRRSTNTRQNLDWACTALVLLLDIVLCVAAKKYINRARLLWKNNQYTPISNIFDC